MNARGWQARAECRHHDPELFFPDPSDTIGQREAKAVCATCPVTVECMAQANATYEQYGIWGGFDRNDEGRPLRPRGRPPKGGHPIGGAALSPSPQANEISTPPTTRPTIAEAAQ
ncbi:WhiB family transcriptional regulator [Mycobacteroides chelonae]|uniref:WhiB family transcriptional regulator n=1 Tax=Mycobacteroides chelonae TaxID=1774 RepID=UPI0008A8B6FA|nr:WhiB family transcriptional regulator [Mycobacteroides chelonae]OHU29047.1 hypothetical protein BKG78_23550 [Mycobacteroides chelonae]